MRSPALRFVVSGEVELFVELGQQSFITGRSATQLKKLLPGECFGELEFFSQTYEMQLSARSVGHT